MTGSSVTIVGCSSELREGQAVMVDVYPYRASIYVGGQSARSRDIAKSMADRLMGEYACAGRVWNCASVRFGNCTHIDVYAAGQGFRWDRLCA